MKRIRCVNCSRMFKAPYNHTRMCFSCTQKMPPDLIIDVGTFHVEAHSDYLSAKKLDRLIAKSFALAKQLST